MNTDKEKQNDNQAEYTQSTAEPNTTEAKQNNQSSSIVDDIKSFANKMLHHQDKKIRYASYGVCGLVGLIIFCSFIALKLNSPRGQRIADRFNKITSDTSSINKSNSRSSSTDNRKFTKKQLKNLADTMRKQVVGQRTAEDIVIKNVRLGDGISYVMEYTVTGNTLENLKNGDRAQNEQAGQEEACKIIKKDPKGHLLLKKLDHVMYEYKGTDDVVYATVKISTDICNIK
jgi:hypothetical protein